MTKQTREEICNGEAAEGFVEALPATAGATAPVLLVLCCSLVGNGIGDSPPGGGGSKGKFDLSLSSSPADMNPRSKSVT